MISLEMQNTEDKVRLTDRSKVRAMLLDWVAVRGELFAGYI